MNNTEKLNKLMEDYQIKYEHKIEKILKSYTKKTSQGIKSISIELVKNNFSNGEYYYRINFLKRRDLHDEIESDNYYHRNKR